MAGNEYRLKYRLHWLADEPYPTPLARCVATRLGRGGEPGKKRPVGVRKFVVEFKGAPLEKLAYGVKPEAVLTSSRGTFSYVFTEAVPDGVAGHWRAQRSEEHTSELQSLMRISYAVFCLKKKKTKRN